jgi:hypothetical protein
LSQLFIAYLRDYITSISSKIQSEISNIKNSAIIVGGNFNLLGWDWRTRTIKPDTKYSNIHYLFGNLFDDTGLAQIVDIPTRKDNTLDLISGL